MVQSIADYRWSSYHHNALGNVGELITPHPLYNALAQVKEQRFVAYKQLFEGRLPIKMIELINNSAEKGDVLGDESYHNQIERIIGRVTIRGRHGGDRKSERFKNQQL
jgi:putative transposase